MAKYHTYWHITPAINLESILSNGVDPMKARSDRKLCWFVRWWGLPHALAHVSARWGVSVDHLYAIRIKVRAGAEKHHRLAMYYSDTVQKRGMVALRGDYALNRWEKQRKYARASK